MFLFKDYFIDAICKGRKTETRRNHKRPRARVGSVHQCRTKLFGDPFAWIRVKRVWQERLRDITQEEVNAEGLGPMTPAEFVEGFMEIAHGHVTPDTMVWCYEFELARPIVEEGSLFARCPICGQPCGLDDADGWYCLNCNQVVGQATQEQAYAIARSLGLLSWPIEEVR